MITMDDALYELFRTHQIRAEDAITFAQDKTSIMNRMPVGARTAPQNDGWQDDTWQDDTWQDGTFGAGDF